MDIRLPNLKGAKKMEELYCDHIGGGLLMVLKGNKVEFTDKNLGVSKTVEFKDSGKAMVFIG